MGAWGVGEEGRELGGIVNERVGEIPEICEGFEGEGVVVFDEGSGGAWQSGEAGDAGEDFAAAVIDDDEEATGLGELGEDPGGGEIVESGEVAEDEPGVGDGRGGAEAQPRGDEAVDAISTAIGVEGDVGREGCCDVVELADGEAITEEDLAARGKELLNGVKEGGFGARVGGEIGG